MLQFYNIAQLEYCETVLIYTYLLFTLYLIIYMLFF